MMRPRVTVAGAGPAGTAAALSAIESGAAVTILDRSAFPRHKVCGEFLSPEIMPLLDRLGVADRVMAAAPARMTRVALRMGRRERIDHLPETAYGLSRYRFDAILLDAAVERGAAFERRDAGAAEPPLVLATGRCSPASSRDDKGDRLFGFKSHFRGPSDDAVELYFGDGCYIGVNPVEGGLTNVCGLAPQRNLARAGFDIDEFIHTQQPLSKRLAPLERAMDWVHTGPLVFTNGLNPAGGREGVYPAGDALSFVDPFTGTGQLNAVITGVLAGRAAARGTGRRRYLDDCSSLLSTRLLIARSLRAGASFLLVANLVPLVPLPALYRWTRASVESNLLK